MTDEQDLEQSTMQAALHVHGFAIDHVGNIWGAPGLRDAAHTAFPQAGQRSAP
jgi:hypothetical protein